ncbi:MAG: hypothetical protein M9916_00950 [Crocinitomicaceae bacterium]|nr:hypothetical protein [Crocinitomicaceae bacterium]
MKIEITITFENIEDWGVDWRSIDEQDYALKELRRDVKIQILKNGYDKVKVSKPIIYKPYSMMSK